MSTYRSVLLATINAFSLNSPDDGYDWGELIEGDWVFEDLSDAQLYVLLLDYLKYMKGE